MEKIKGIIQKDIKSYFANFKINILLFIVFPVVLSHLYGVFLTNTFDPNRTIEPFNISINDEDNSLTSNTLKEIFKDEGFSELIILGNKEESLVSINIEKGFQEDLNNEKTSTIEIEKLREDADFQLEMVKSIVQDYLDYINTNINLKKSIMESSIPENEKEDLISKYIEYVNMFYKSKPIEVINADNVKRLNSHEYYSGTMLAFTTLFIIFELAKKFIEEKENGTLKRLYSTNIKKREVYYSKYIFNFLICVISITLYVIIKKITVSAFNIDILPLSIAILVHSLLICGVSSLLVVFVKSSKVINLLSGILIPVFAFFGGIFFDASYVGDSLFMNIVPKLTPNYWVQKIYHQLMEINSLDSILNLVIVIIVITLVTSAISFIKLKVLWEE